MRSRVSLLAVTAATLASLVLAAAANAIGGTAHSWGKNDKGELATGSTSPYEASPTTVGALGDVVALAGGGEFSLALVADGTVRAWGDNTHGQLGNGTLSPAYGPYKVPGLDHIVAIDAGYEFGIALRADGTVFTWGRNDGGELGDGEINTTGCLCIESPTPVTGLSRVSSIAAGDYAGMVLLRDGTVMDWGFDGRGDLGAGAATTTGCRCRPSPVRVKGLSRVVAIAHGSYNGFALLANRTLMDWGYNDAGELGNGAIATGGCYCVPSAKAVPGLTDVVQVAAGYQYAVALLGSGSVRGWGWNPNGEVGNGTASPATGCQCVQSPAAVTGLSGASAVGDGGQHALALRGNGTLEAWGWNAYGQLGNASTSATGCQCVPSPGPVDGLGGATAVTGGYFHSLAVAGPSQRLSVARTGAGSGVVGGQSIVCPTTCAHRYPQGTYVALRAVAAGKAKFAGFSGACKGTGPCRVRLDADRKVVATFGPPKGTRLTAAAIHPKQHSARFAFAAPGAVTGYQCRLIRTGHKPKPKFRKCGSPKAYANLKSGDYTFVVRARDTVGHDPAPAKRSFHI